MGDAAAGGDAQNATLTTVLNQLWGEQRCGVDTPALPDVDIGRMVKVSQKLYYSVQ